MNERLQIVGYFMKRKRGKKALKTLCSSCTRCSRCKNRLLNVSDEIVACSEFKAAAEAHGTPYLPEGKQEANGNNEAE
jgi:hypothetical protein